MPMRWVRAALIPWKTSRTCSVLSLSSWEYSTTNTPLAPLPLLQQGVGDTSSYTNNHSSTIHNYISIMSHKYIQKMITFDVKYSHAVRFHVNYDATLWKLCYIPVITSMRGYRSPRRQLQKNRLPANLRAHDSDRFVPSGPLFLENSVHQVQEEAGLGGEAIPRPASQVELSHRSHFLQGL